MDNCLLTRKNDLTQLIKKNFSIEKVLKKKMFSLELK